jgi:hypothetical protein
MDTNTSNTSNTNVSTGAATAPPPATTPKAGKARVAVSPLLTSTNAVFIVISGHVVNGMTGNAAFPTPDPKIADVVAARDAYIAAVDAAKDSTIAVAVRRQLRQALVALLRKLALYVQAASGGDLPTLLSSGFTAQRVRQPVGELTAPINLRLSRGKTSGQIVARFTPLAKAGAYEWRYAMSTTPLAWERADTTLAAKTTLQGLVPGMQYIVQVRAIGTAGPSDWSDAAMLMAA